MQAEEVEIILASGKTNYIIGEPLKFSVKLHNNSTSVINVPSVARLGDNYRHYYLEVVDPDGKVEARYNKKSYEDEYFPYQYSGEPIQPGDSIEFFIYPTVTSLLEENNSIGYTFDVPGEYRVRLAYHIDQRYVNLWNNNGEIAYSNELRLVFREPDKDESEILSSIWSKTMRFVESCEYCNVCMFDEQHLEEIMSKYANHPLIPYVIYFLARRYTTRELHNYSRACELYEQLIISHPDFRHSEVMTHAAYAYYKQNRMERARYLVNKALKDHPSLKDHYNFMRIKLVIDNRGHQGDPVGKWVYDRLNYKHK